MRSSLRHWTSNPVTALLVVQLILIGGGYVLTRICVHGWNKLYGPSAAPVAIEWGRCVVRYGLLAILLPGIWGA